MPQSTTKRRPSKPSTSPSAPPDFPLWKHPTGRWCKKIKGRFHYFGYVAADPTGQAALDRWNREKDYLLSGRTPPPPGVEFVTVLDICNLFIESKERLFKTGEIAKRTYDRYYGTCQYLLKAFGKGRSIEDLTVADFESLRAKMAKRWGVVALGVELAIIRAVLKYAYESGAIEKPIRYGRALQRPPARLVRLHRATKLRMFEREELLGALRSASSAAKAMLLLGVNAALGNTDLAELPTTALDLNGGWLNYPRGKTGVGRRVPLWPETVQALNDAITTRGEAKDATDADLVFLGRDGTSLAADRRGNLVSGRIRRLLERSGVMRPGLNFYALRHTFATIAGDTGDQVAIDAIMGHAPPQNDMRATYRERINDDRLRKVAEHVRSWLFGQIPTN